MKFAFGEGIAKTTIAGAMKFIGLAVTSVVVAFLYSLFTAIIQMVGGLLGSKIRKDALRPPEAKAIITAGLFGTIAVAMTVISVYTYMIGADLGIRTFIYVTSIIPGAFIDWAFFSHPLNRRQWLLGIPMFLVAGWFILGFPSLSTVLALPPWVWLTFIVAALAAINEGLTQATAQVKKFNSLPNNFWVGLFSIIISLVGLGILWALGVSFTAPPGAFWAGVAVAGTVVIAMLSFKLLAYKQKISNPLCH